MASMRSKIRSVELTKASRMRGVEIASEELQQKMVSSGPESCATRQDRPGNALLGHCGAFSAARRGKAFNQARWRLRGEAGEPRPAPRFAAAPAQSIFLPSFDTLNLLFFRQRFTS